MAKDESAKNKNDPLAIIVTLVLFSLFMWWIGSMYFGGGEKVEASIFSQRAVDQDELMVEYRVTNTTDKTGKSSCAITMRDDENKYNGSDAGYMSGKEIAPGEIYSGIARVKVSGNGANSITKGSIDCTIE